MKYSTYYVVKVSSSQGIIWVFKTLRFETQESVKIVKAQSYVISCNLQKIYKCISPSKLLTHDLDQLVDKHGLHSCHCRSIQHVWNKKCKVLDQVSSVPMTNATTFLQRFCFSKILVHATRLMNFLT